MTSTDAGLQRRHLQINTVVSVSIVIVIALVHNNFFHLLYLLGVGEPGRLLGPVSAACGLKELVLTVGMALLTRRPHVAMLMFI